MANWTPLRRARDNIKSNRPVSRLPSVINTILNEIISIKKEIEYLKKKSSK